MFAPTMLLVMTHNATGLKYFCKTSRTDRVAWYKGSGVAWRKHLAKHGADVDVGVLGFYVDKERCLEAAKKFSRENNIVESADWANLVEELGKNGASMKGERNPFFGKTHSQAALQKMKMFKTGISVNAGVPKSKEHREKLSAALKGRPNPEIAKKLTGRKLSEETKQKISEAGKGKAFSDERKERLRQAALHQWAAVREQRSAACG